MSLLDTIKYIFLTEGLNGEKGVCIVKILSLNNIKNLYGY